MSKKEEIIESFLKDAQILANSDVDTLHEINQRLFNIVSGEDHRFPSEIEVAFSEYNKGKIDQIARPIRINEA